MQAPASRLLSRRSLVLGLTGIVALEKTGLASEPHPFLITDFGASPGSDVSHAFASAVRAAERNGGGRIIFPPSGSSGWTIDQTCYVKSSNIHVVLQDNIKLGAVEKSSAFVFEGERDRPISDVSISGSGSTRLIDGNGRNFREYSYSTSDTFYSCVLFKYCTDWLARDVYGYNGLVNCLRAFFCGPGQFVDCLSSHSVFDNGQSIDFDLTEQASSSGGTVYPEKASIIRPVSWKCAGFGVTSYAATGIRIIGAEVYDCGSEDVGAPVAGGGISVEADYFTAGRENIDHHVNILSSHVRNCINHGLFVTAPGVEAEGLEITSTYASKRRDDMDSSGSNVLILSAGGLVAHNAKILDSARHGIMVVGAHQYRPSLDFDGLIDGAQEDGIYQARAKSVVTSPRTIIKNVNLRSKL